MIVTVATALKSRISTQSTKQKAVKISCLVDRGAGAAAVPEIVSDQQRQ